MRPPRQQLRRLLLRAGSLPGLFLLALGAALLAFRNRTEILRGAVQVGLMLGLLALLARLPRLVRRWRETLLVLASTALALLAVQYLLGPLVLHRIVLPLYNLDIDHRQRHLPGSTNEDGIRPDIRPSDYRPEDFVILFLGDSVTMGHGVAWDEAFPFLVEKELRARYPERSVRVANFAWPSSSPVLQERQLRQIGRKYRPDLVVQALDMTDFADDISYAAALQKAGADRPTELSPLRAMGIRFGLLLGIQDLPAWLRQNLVFLAPRADTVARVHPLFPLCQPLEQSEPTLETTWRAITGTEAAAREMGARFALFVLPRHWQYGRAEGPPDPDLDGEACRPYYLEPFRFFEKRRAAAPFPIHPLLDDFREAQTGPLIFPDDYHYNALGHRLAARAIVRDLIADGIVK